MIIAAGSAIFPVGMAALPAGIVPFPTGIVPLPPGMAVLPAGMAMIPTGIASVPTGMAMIPGGIASIPVGTVIFPAGIASFPAGKTTIPAGKTAFPAGKLRNYLEINGLLFCRRGGHGRWRRGCGRTGSVMTAHTAADGLEFDGRRGAFAQQTHHGIHHAAGIVVSSISRILQIRGRLHVLHFQRLLFGRLIGDRFQFSLQPRDMRRGVEIFRRQRRLIVGVVHVGDDFINDANFFGECVHDILSFGFTKFVCL